MSEEYNAIAVALSKDGIQALLIEDAIPEIEQEANHLLSRLTDNQAHLSIESLRDLRSGEQKKRSILKFPIILELDLMNYFLEAKPLE